MFLLVMVEVVLILGPTTSTPQNMILAETGMMSGLVHLRISAQYPTWFYLVVKIIHLMIPMVLYLVLVLVMVKAVWVLGPPTLTSKTNIFGFMVLILCHMRVGIIHP